MLAREALAGRLERASRRIEELEGQLMSARAALAARTIPVESGCQTMATDESRLDEEVVARLAMVAPVLRDRLRAAWGMCPAMPISHLQMIRRNVAVHNFLILASQIQQLPRSTLNRVQRYGRMVDSVRKAERTVSGKRDCGEGDERPGSIRQTAWLGGLWLMLAAVAAFGDAAPPGHPSTIAPEMWPHGAVNLHGM